MDMDEMMQYWKKDDASLAARLSVAPVQTILKKNSRTAMRKINRRLKGEVLFILVAASFFDWLFFAVHLPFTPIRWTSFIIFNSIASVCAYSYLQAIIRNRLNFNHSLESNYTNIIGGLNRFNRAYKLLNVPIALICFLMFAGSQNLLIILPWMIAEFLLYRFLLFSNQSPRFSSYVDDLTYSLRQLKEPEL